MARERVAKLLAGKGKERPDPLRQAMQALMMEYGSVFRDEKGLKKGLAEIRAIKERYQEVVVSDHGKTFNYDLMEAVELGNSLDLSEAILASALHREESRGAHFRTDFPNRDDQNFLKHTLVFRADTGLEVKYKPVIITRFQPQARVY